MAEKTEIVIIGAGVAGAATAYFLAQRGCREIIVLEKELLPGMHSSGRNAAMMRQNVPEELNCRLAYESMSFFNHPPVGFPDLNFKPTGSLLLASGEALAELKASTAMHERVGLKVDFLSPKQALNKVPALNPESFEGAFFCQSDGTIDIQALIQGYLQGAAKQGASIRTGTEVKSILSKNGRILGVKTSKGEIHAERVIDAAGAWASLVANTAESSAPIQPHRRHLVVTEPIDWVDPNWPFTWHVSGDFYFRPELGGLLMSPCDTEAFPASNVKTSAALIEETKKKAQKLLPKLRDTKVIYSWAGLRNLTPDHLFIVGDDPKLKGLFWVAGLGGHGVTASPALGQIAADLILDGKTTRLDVSSMSPARFLENRTVRSSITKDALL